MQRAIARPAARLSRVHWNQDYVDVILAVGLAVASIVSAHRAGVALNAVSVSLLLLQTLPIAVRRRNPIRTLMVTGLFVTAYSVLGYPQTGSFLGVLFAFYTVAAHEPRRAATISAAVTAVCIAISLVAYVAVNSVASLSASVVGTYFSFGLAWLIGDNLRVRRAYTRELEERATTLEREREERAELAVASERGRIARELHDVVAHHLSVMVVQTAAARRVVEKDPAAAREALESVEEAGRTALAEMRRMLEVLRAETAGMGPQPGLGDLERLAEKVRETGLPVEAVVEGKPCPLPAGMDLAAYRIIQEALTNVVKHAGRASARVNVRYECDSLDIEVTDDGRGAAAPLLSREVDEGGMGLVGMRERVALYGGTLETGPLFPGGYRVHAHFPLEPGRRGSRAECCDEESALSQVATAAKRDRERERAVVRPSSSPSPSELVRPRVVPPLIGRVVPPHPQPHQRQRPATARPTRQTPSRTQTQPPDRGNASGTGDE